MYATLVVVGGRADKRQLNVKLPTVLGRSRQADPTIAHSPISRNHCELREHEGVVLLIDLGSLNGTLCRNRKIQRVPLLPGDRFSIGPLTFEIRYECDGDIEMASQGHVEVARDAPPINLPDPIEPSQVELGESVEASVHMPHCAKTVLPPHVTAQRNRKLPGFTHRECSPDRGDERSQCDHEVDRTLEINSPIVTEAAASVSYDIPTSQGDNPGGDREPEPTDSASDEAERED